MTALRSVILLFAWLPSLAAAEALTLYAVNYPLEYFAERIGGDLVDARFPGPLDEDPAFWKPTPDLILEYQKADLILLNGANYARWTRHASLPRRTQVDTSRSFRDRYLSGSDGGIHSHGPEGGHSHSGVAFTTWVDPNQAITQARAIETALSRIRPEKAAAFAAGADALEADLVRLGRELEAAFELVTDESVLASHPVYQYLARRYGLDVRALLWEPDVTPDAAAWAQLDRILDERPATHMIWEAEPIEETWTELTRRGIHVIVFEPCANRPSAGDYLTVMRGNVASVRSSATPSRSDR